MWVKFMNKIYRKTYAAINLENISHNFERLSEMSANTSLIPVVKADAYGHGADAIVKHLYYNHAVRLFAVSLLEEALALKALNLDVEILIMGPLQGSELSVVSEQDFIFTLTGQRLWNHVKMSKLPLRFDLKVDTGMHRLGFQNESEIIEVFNYARQHDNLTIEGIYTHFATADSDKAYFNEQRKRFNALLKVLPRTPSRIHVSNSSSIIKYEKTMPFNTHARLGISLYGYSLEEEVNFLKPVMDFITHVAEIKVLKPGEKLGYNITYEATAWENIAILPVGYADGWIRMNQGGMVSIGNNLYPIVGRVCMDMTFVKVDQSVNPGDKVKLFGEGKITADTIAKRTKTISYEVLCQVSKRVPRVYNGK